MKKNTVLNFVIVFLILSCVGVGMNIVYKNYKLECESYNSNIVDLAVDLIKGNCSYEEIDSLDAPENIKDSFREYYNNSFYSSTDKLLVYEDINVLLEEKEEILEYIDKTNFLVGSSELNFQLELDFSEYFYNDQSNPNVLDSSTLHFIYGVQNLCNDLNDSSYLFVEDGNLYAKVEDLSFVNGEHICYYSGFKFVIYRDVLEKKIRSEIQNDLYYQSYKISNVFEEDGQTVCVLKDDLSNKKYIKYDTSFGKINSIQM